MQTESENSFETVDFLCNGVHETHQFNKTGTFFKKFERLALCVLGERFVEDIKPLIVICGRIIRIEAMALQGDFSAEFFTRKQEGTNWGSLGWNPVGSTEITQRLGGHGYCSTILGEIDWSALLGTTFVKTMRTASRLDETVGVGNIDSILDAVNLKKWVGNTIPAVWEVISTPVGGYYGMRVIEDFIFNERQFKARPRRVKVPIDVQLTPMWFLPKTQYGAMSTEATPILRLVTRYLTSDVDWDSQYMEQIKRFHEIAAKFADWEVIDINVVKRSAMPTIILKLQNKTFETIQVTLSMQPIHSNALLAVFGGGAEVEDYN